jgi:hypothetical protein
MAPSPQGGLGTDRDRYRGCCDLGDSSIDGPARAGRPRRGKQFLPRRFRPATHAPSLKGSPTTSATRTTESSSSSTREATSAARSHRTRTHAISTSPSASSASPATRSPVATSASSSTEERPTTSQPLPSSRCILGPRSTTFWATTAATPRTAVTSALSHATRSSPASHVPTRSIENQPQPLLPINTLAGLDRDGNVVACLAPRTAVDGFSPLSDCQ